MNVTDDGRSISLKTTDATDLAILEQRFAAIVPSGVATETAGKPRHDAEDGKIEGVCERENIRPVAARPRPLRRPFVSATVQFMVRDMNAPDGFAPRAAIVSFVYDDDAIDCVVFNRSGFLFNSRVAFGGSRAATWRWAPETLRA